MQEHAIFKPGLHQKFVGGEIGSIGQFATAKFLTADVALGSHPEELRLSISSPLHPQGADVQRTSRTGRLGPIVLQKSKVAGLKILRENTKQRAIADSYDLNRVTEVACEFRVRP